VSKAHVDPVRVTEDWMNRIGQTWTLSVVQSSMPYRLQLCFGQVFQYLVTVRPLCLSHAALGVMQCSCTLQASDQLSMFKEAFFLVPAQAHELQPTGANLTSIESRLLPQDVLFACAESGLSKIFLCWLKTGILDHVGMSLSRQSQKQSYNLTL
jgi:hypothetical protein